MYKIIFDVIFSLLSLSILILLIVKKIIYIFCRVSISLTIT